MQTSVLGDPKLVVLGLETLALDVLLEHLVRDVAAESYEVPPGPQVSVPKLLAELTEVLQQMMRRSDLLPSARPARGDGFTGRLR